MHAVGIVGILIQIHYLISRSNLLYFIVLKITCSHSFTINISVFRRGFQFHPDKTNCTLSNGDSECETNLLENSLIQATLIPKTECEYDQEHELDSLLPLKMEPEGYSLTFTDALGTQVPYLYLA